MKKSTSFWLCAWGTISMMFYHHTWKFFPYCYHNFAWETYNFFVKLWAINALSWAFALAIFFLYLLFWHGIPMLNKLIDNEYDDRF